MRRFLPLLAVAALAAAAPASAASPAAYRTQARRVCTQTKRTLEQAARGLPPTKAGLRRFLERALPAGERYLARVRALSPPSSLAAKHRQLVAVVTREIAVFRAAV